MDMAWVVTVVATADMATADMATADTATMDMLTATAVVWVEYL